MKLNLPNRNRYFQIFWKFFKISKNFTIIDTGGIIPGDEDEIMLSIYDQARIACEEAEKIIFIVDGIEGTTPVDMDIANIFCYIMCRMA